SRVKIPGDSRGTPAISGRGELLSKAASGIPTPYSHKDIFGHHSVGAFGGSTHDAHDRVCPSAHIAPRLRDSRIKKSWHATPCVTMPRARTRVRKGGLEPPRPC